MKQGLIKGLGLLMFSGMLLCGCESDKTAVIKVSLIDAPADYEFVNIDIVDVQVNASEEDGGWQSLENAEMGIYDLLKLTNGEEAFLGEIELPEGKLGQVRLILGDKNELGIDGATETLKVPSGSQSGLKLKVNADIVSGITYKLIIDFDAAKSIVKAGNSGKYLLKPVIRAQMEEQTGAIEGVISPKEIDAVLYAILDGDSTSTFPNEDGEYHIGALTEGSYDVVAIPSEESGYIKTTIEDINVVIGVSSKLDTLFLAQ
ncbi:DUF4382 domain-containing protein [Bacteroidota bacterium]